MWQLLHTLVAEREVTAAAIFHPLLTWNTPKKLQNGQLGQFREWIPNLSKSQSFFTTAPSQAPFSVVPVTPRGTQVTPSWNWNQLHQQPQVRGRATSSRLVSNTVQVKRKFQFMALIYVFNYTSLFWAPISKINPTLPKSLRKWSILGRFKCNKNLYFGAQVRTKLLFWTVLCEDQKQQSDARASLRKKTRETPCTKWEMEQQFQAGNSYVCYSIWGKTQADSVFKNTAQNTL